MRPYLICFLLCINVRSASHIVAHSASRLFDVRYIEMAGIISYHYNDIDDRAGLG